MWKKKYICLSGDNKSKLAKRKDKKRKENLKKGLQGTNLRKVFSQKAF